MLSEKQIIIQVFAHFAVNIILLILYFLSNYYQTAGTDQITT